MPPGHHLPQSHSISSCHHLPPSHFMSSCHHLPSSHFISPCHHLPPSHSISFRAITCHRQFMSSCHHLPPGHFISSWHHLSSSHFIRPRLYVRGRIYLLSTLRSILNVISPTIKSLHAILPPPVIEWRHVIVSPRIQPWPLNPEWPPEPQPMSVIIKIREDP